VARPLREQFVIAMLALLVPVVTVMAFASAQTYREQVDRLQQDAARLAVVIAAHVDETAPEDALRLGSFLARLDLPPGAEATVVDASGATIERYAQPGGGVEEFLVGLADVSSRGWTVRVGLPTELASQLAGPVYQRIVLISGLATVILLVVQWAFLGRWLPSLRRFEQDVDRVGRGDLTTPEPVSMPSRELEHLREAFSGMVDRLRGAQAAIAAQVEEERRMRTRVESLQQQVIRQERLAAIGVLVSGIAHELNNPLQAISGFSDLLRRDKDISEAVRADLALIAKEGARAAAIIRNLSRFGRQQGADPSIVLTSEVIGSVVELRQRGLQEQNIDLQLDQRATRPVLAVFTELQQVLLNFVINAEQAIIASNPLARRIVIRTRDRAEGLVIEVEDTGPGVPAADESKLFQPFFTTKAVGEGTGLGLSVSYGIVRSLGGTIGYRGAEEGGAVFFVELPDADAGHQS
jgi:C4-dicarboxylate-specific signal transduction histidine kinase